MGRIRSAQCRVCGAPREEGEKQALCRTCRRKKEAEHCRKWRERHPERSAASVAKRNEKRRLARIEAVDGKRPCQTAGCHGVVITPFGFKCEVCKSEANRRRGEATARAARRSPVKAKAPAYVPKFRPVQPDIAIGPEAFPTLKPVDVEGRDILRLPCTWQAEEEERERSWAAWFEARGL